MKHPIPLSQKEVKKLEIVESVRAGRLTQEEAAARYDTTARSIRNWTRTVEAEGAAGLIHGNRGTESPKKVPKEERKTILTLIRKDYADYGPTLASEVLVEDHQIDRDVSTIRDLMIADGMWIPNTRGQGGSAVHRQWRERRACRGELVQFDGSYHHWLEDRGGTGELCLLAAIDDATSEVLYAEFAPHEGTLPVMAFWTRYARLHGLPQAIYLDRFSTYKMKEQVAANNPDVKTQFQRACATLGVTPIFARSPQAKGRVEKLFKTLQDRFVKALRRAQIDTVKEANHFLQETFLPAFNRQFAGHPRDPKNLHRRLSVRALADLPNTFCRIEERKVQNDFTVSFNGQWMQILPTKRLAIRPKDRVLVREYPDGQIAFFIRDQQLEVKPIAKHRSTTTPSSKPMLTLVTS